MLVAQAHSFAAQARLAVTLSWVAGYTNLLCLLIVSHPTSHISGTASLLGQYLVEPSRYREALWPLVFLLGTFVLGAAVSGGLTEMGRRRRWNSIYVLPIAVEGLLLAVVALCIELTGREPLAAGAAVWVISGCAAAAMGLQNATITRISSGVVRTTHVTGVATDLGMESAQLLFAAWDYRRRGAPHPHGQRRHEGPLSGKRLALLLSIFGSFVFGAALAALLYDNVRVVAVYPPVLFLLWVIYTDSTRPIAAIEALDRHAGDHGLPAGLAVFHVRRDPRRFGKTHRLPNLLTWADNLNESVSVVVLDLDHIAVLDDNAAMELRVAVEHLKHASRRLVLAGVTPEQHAQLERLGVLAHLEPLSVYADFELALARGLVLLPHGNA
ncbi:MAG TPA: DUF1275 family protein [Phycisphaerales bacterium]|nr:DUF1275 family protein [Phycisphaerales bacterium]